MPTAAEKPTATNAAFIDMEHALDPNYAAALNLLARTHFMDVWLGSSKSPEASLMTAIDLTQKAIALDDSLADSHALLGYLYTLTRQHDKAIAQGERAVELDPRGPSYLSLTSGLESLGRTGEAREVFEEAIAAHQKAADVFAELLAEEPENPERLTQYVDTLLQIAHNRGDLRMGRSRGRG